jgi:hypothetical protein
MPTALPYLQSNKNLETLFTKIAAAKVPDSFSHDFLRTTIGLKGSNDRSFIPLLRNLGFLNQSNAPTATYGELKNEKKAKVAIAAAIASAYKPLFDANENAYKLPQDELKGLVAQVAGSDEDMTSRIVNTFNALVKLGDWSAKPAAKEDSKTNAREILKELEADATKKNGLKPEFHYNIQIHLPANGAEEVYLGIFNALRKVFQ